MAKNENEIIDPPDIQLQRLVEKTVDVAKKARRNRAPLSGLNFYADKLAKLKTDAVVYFQPLNDPSVGDISAMAAVMMRRLLETSIIEAFEAHRLDAKIKNAQGDFFQLSDLVGAALSETAWNLSRNTKKALPNLRDVGHRSAHSRRYTAQKPDILKVSQDCRIAIEEFLHLAGLIA
jgi:hypothetical protein